MQVITEKYDMCDDAIAPFGLTSDGSAYEGTSYTVKIAPSGRAGCKGGCKGTIPKVRCKRAPRRTPSLMSRPAWMPPACLPATS